MSADRFARIKQRRRTGQPAPVTDETDANFGWLALVRKRPWQHRKPPRHLWEYVTQLQIPAELKRLNDVCTRLFYLAIHAMVHGWSEQQAPEATPILFVCALREVQTALRRKFAAHLKHTPAPIYTRRTQSGQSQWTLQNNAGLCDAALALWQQNIADNAGWGAKFRAEGVNALDLVFTGITVPPRDKSRHARETLEELVLDNNNNPGKGTVFCCAEWTLRRVLVNAEGALLCVEQFTQLQCTLALQTLAQKWHAVSRVQWAWSVWGYVDLVQARCFQLIMKQDLPRSVCNMECPQWSVDTRTGGYQVSEAWTAWVWTQFFYLRRIQSNLLRLRAHCNKFVEHHDLQGMFAPMAVDEADAEDLRVLFQKCVGGFYHWTRERATLAESNEDLKTHIARQVWRFAALVFGDQEHYRRANKGAVPIDTRGTHAQGRSFAQHHFWTELEQQTLTNMMRVETGTPWYVREQIMLCLFAHYMKSTCQIAWDDQCVLREHKFLRAEDDENRWVRTAKILGQPVVVQVAGGFCVWHKDRLYETRWLAHSVVWWVLLVHLQRGKQHPGTHFIHENNAKQDISRGLDTLVEKWQQLPASSSDAC